MPSGYNINLLIVQIIIIVLLFGIVIWLLRLNRLTRLERRFNKFTVSVIKDNELSLFDKLIKIYNNAQKRMSKFLYKLKIFDEYSKVDGINVKKIKHSIQSVKCRAENI